MDSAVGVGTRQGGHRTLPLPSVVLAAGAASIAVDFALHAGLLAPAYDWSSPFLVSPAQAFARIPAGYLAFVVLAWALAWLLMRLDIRTAREGAAAGLAAGALLWAAFLLALWSIATAQLPLLLAWWAGQTVELGVAGAVIGAMLRGASARWVAARILLVAAAAISLAIVLQSIGYATAPVIVD